MLLMPNSDSHFYPYKISKNRVYSKKILLDSKMHYFLKQRLPLTAVKMFIFMTETFLLCIFDNFASSKLLMTYINKWLVDQLKNHIKNG